MIKYIGIGLGIFVIIFWFLLDITDTIQADISWWSKVIILFFFGIVSTVASTILTIFAREWVEQDDRIKKGENMKKRVDKITPKPLVIN